MATTQLRIPESSDAAPETEPLTASADAATCEPLGDLVPEVYEELRRLAAAYLRRERATHTLQATALVHEAYLRLSHQAGIEWQNPRHVVAMFARVMRQTLTNHAVGRSRLKRGGADPMTLTLEFYDSRNIDVRVLDQALEALEVLDRRQAEIVELRFFGGLTIDEIAELLGISPATVKREWTIAKIWLRRELTAEP